MYKIWTSQANIWTRRAINGFSFAYTQGTYSEKNQLGAASHIGADQGQSAGHGFQQDVGYDIHHAIFGRAARQIKKQKPDGITQRCAARVQQR
jgi:hypothetical protein